MAEYKGVMIFAEVSQGRLATIATELLGCGRGWLMSWTKSYGRC